MKRGFMRTITFNDALTLKCPDAFEEMSSTELKQVFKDDNPDRKGFWNKEEHVIMAVLWHTTNKLLVTLFGKPKGIAESNEARLRKIIGPHGYHLEGFFETTIADKKAYGFSYIYNVGDIKQYCKTVTVFNNITCYNFYFYGRTENREIDETTISEILNSAQFN